MATRFARGGRLLAFGNGGSATDAGSAVELFLHPPSGVRCRLWRLVEDRAVITALANDVGYELVFSRQIIAHGRAGDIAIGFSTSGAPTNVLEGLEEAARRGLMTLGLAGYEGGPMASSLSIEYPFVVRSDSVHRIQEAQSALVLRFLVGRAGEPGRRSWGGRVTDAVRMNEAERRDQVENRESAVFERIEAFRRRKPRLRDEVVTLAHGAGGKASAALLEAIFVPAFGAGERHVPTDAAVVHLPAGDRLAFSTDSFVVHPLSLPGRVDRRSGGQRHGQRSGHDGRPPDRSVRGVRARRGLCHRRSPFGRGRHGRRRGACGVAIVTGDTKVVDRGSADERVCVDFGYRRDPVGPRPGRPEGSSR